MRVREIAIVLFALVTVALQVQPATVTVEGGSGTDFDHVFTLVNDQPRPLSVQIVPSIHSIYLADSFLLSDDSLVFSPRETKNLQVRGTVPTLGPEVHRLQYDVIGDGRVLSSFVIRMPIEGEPKLHAQLDIDVQDVVANEAVSAQLSLRNFGNVIAYYTLKLRVLEVSNLIGELSYPAAEQVLPGDEKELTLLFTEILDPGSYSLEVVADVNGAEELIERSPFRVVLVDEQRTIQPGEDLVLTLKNYDGFKPVVTHIIREDGQELSRDTQTGVEETFTIPTSRLAEGDYVIDVLVAHDKGTDKTVLNLRVEEERESPLPLIAIIITVAVIISLVRRKAVLLFRITLLSFQIWRRERKVRLLLKTVHRISAYDVRRPY